MNSYLTLPINATLLINKKEHPTCDLKQSIAQSLHLISTTYYEECKFDDTYGCPIWENDFETIASVNVWTDKTAKLVEEVINQHEKRLSEVKVSLGMMQEEFLDTESKIAKQVKKRIEMKVKAKIEETNELFEFNTYFYFSPISFD